MTESSETAGDIMPGRDASVDELRRDIVQTRTALGETLQALAGRADVKARVRTSAARTADRVRASVRDAGRSPVPWLVLAAAAGVVAVVVLMRWGRR